MSDASDIATSAMAKKRENGVPLIPILLGLSPPGVSPPHTVQLESVPQGIGLPWMEVQLELVPLGTGLLQKKVQLESIPHGTRLL